MPTNQDEVLKLAEAAGIKIYCDTFPGHIGDKVIKLIALAKAEAYEDAAKVLRDNGMYGGTIYEAIRNRAKEQP